VFPFVRFALLNLIILVVLDAHGIQFVAGVLVLEFGDLLSNCPAELIIGLTNDMMFDYSTPFA